MERKPGGEVLRINHPDGTRESFTYNARGLPIRRQDPKGLIVGYQYDKALRLATLT
ncbi:RHS repeat domain-containing protein, partial [Pseudomonas syringae pv. tagetis]